ncbi:MAG: S6e family ribosomal protein [Promethearchaeota archaeon]
MSSEKIVYKLNISGGKEGPGKGLSKLIEIDEKKFRFEGMKIGDSFKGGLIGFTNYEFEITGGSDTSGFPMRKDVHGPVKKKILVSKRGIGYKQKAEKRRRKTHRGIETKRKGEKRRRTVRGNEITYDMTLINLKVVKYGEAELFKKETE